MPSTNNRALLLELTAFLAENNIRRGVLSCAVNAQALASAYQEESRNIAPSGTYTYTSLSPNSMIVMRVSKPVRLTITKASVVWVPFMVNSLFVFSDSFDSVVIANLSTTDTSNVTLLQV
jgi:hypothetical protein